MSRKTGPSTKQFTVVEVRAESECEARFSTECNGQTQQIHHRRPRGAGGTTLDFINWPSNLLYICEPCHRCIEYERHADAVEAGLSVSKFKVPHQVPATLRYGRVFLFPDGGTLPAEEKEVS